MGGARHPRMRRGGRHASQPAQANLPLPIVYDIDKAFSMRGLADTKEHAEALAEWLTLLARRTMGIMPVE